MLQNGADLILGYDPNFGLGYRAAEAQLQDGKNTMGREPGFAIAHTPAYVGRVGEFIVRPLS